MATAATTYTFVPSTTILASEANTNFADLVAFLNNSAMHKDASSAFTAIPSGPATDPTTANQLTRKQYVNDQDATRLKPSSASSQTAFNTAAVTPTAQQMLVQAGSAYLETSGSGGYFVNYPTAFPNGVLTVVCTSAKENSDIVTVDPSSYATNRFTARWYNNAGATINNLFRRCNWIAVGW